VRRVFNGAVGYDWRASCRHNVVLAQDIHNSSGNLKRVVRLDPTPVSKQAKGRLAALLLLACPLAAQIMVDTFAGGTIRSGVPAQDVALSDIAGLAWDSAGNLIFCQRSANVIRRIRPDGIIETIAGNGTTGFSGDGGPAVAATLAMPSTPRFDAQGNLYFIDSQNYRIRRIDTHGMITTVAGDGVPFVSGMDVEGPALQRSLITADLAVDNAGNLYFTDSNTDFVRRVTAAGRIEIFAGVAHPDCPGCSAGDGGPALAAKINQPSLLAFDGAGNLYVGEGSYKSHIRRITPDGIISSLSATFPGFGLSAMAADRTGNVYVIQLENPGPVNRSPIQIRRIDANGNITTVAAGQVSFPRGLAVDAQSNLAFDDNAGTVVREFTAQGMLQTLAGGSPQPAPDGTPARNAWFLNPVAIAFNNAGDVYIGDAGSCLIQKIGADGLLATVAGTGTCGSHSPPPSSTKQDLAPPARIAVDSQNRLYVVDTYGKGYVIAPDGNLTTASFTEPGGTSFGIALDSKDRVYILHQFSLVRVSPDGTQENLIAPPSQPGVPPGSGSGPSGLGAIGVDRSRNVYFTGTYPGTPTDYIFRVNDDGTFSPVYGNPSNPMRFGLTTSLAVDASGNVWLPTTIVNAVGTLAVGFAGGDSGDGGPAQAALFNTTAVALSPGGEIYLIDNNRIRKLSGSGPAAAPAIAAVVNAASYTGGAIAPGELLSIFGYNFGITGMGLGTTALKVNVPENNHIPFVLGRTKVFFNGGNAGPGTITAITPYQINVFAPDILEPGTPVNIVVQVDATPSAPVSVPVVAAVPGLAAADQSGSGEGAILNQDGSVNSTANPAARGSIVSLFGTGEGSISPQLFSGYLTISTPFSAPTKPVSVSIGGQPADIIYVGEAPFQPAGVFQINARIPAAIAAGNAPISVSIGGIATSKTITVAVR